MRERHGDWPLYVPPEQPSEEWALYEAMAAPFTACLPVCDARCECDDLQEERQQ
jgi:hypothetical protein